MGLQTAEVAEVCASSSVHCARAPGDVRWTLLPMHRGPCCHETRDGLREDTWRLLCGAPRVPVRREAVRAGRRRIDTSPLRQRTVDCAPLVSIDYCEYNIWKYMFVHIRFNTAVLRMRAMVHGK